MAKKQSNTSENSAAEQGAKPGIFIPIPTAEITNAAETARIRAEKEAEEARIRAEKEAEEARKKAEKEAKEKADKKAADTVVALISAIGVVEYTDAFLERINAAKQAYAKLTADQKKLVENADVITTSKKEYDKLKIAAEKAAEEARKKAEETRIRAEKKAEAARQRAKEAARKRAETRAKKKAEEEANQKSEEVVPKKETRKVSINRAKLIFTIFHIVYYAMWVFFFFLNVVTVYYSMHSGFSCLLWASITVAVCWGINFLQKKEDDEYLIIIDSLDAGTIARLAWRICWVLGLSIICEIIMMVIFVF